MEILRVVRGHQIMGMHTIMIRVMVYLELQ